MKIFKVAIIFMGIAITASGCNNINYTLERSEYLNRCTDFKKDNAWGLSDYCMNKPIELKQKYGDPPPMPLW